jgi:hypothetical protein
MKIMGYMPKWKWDMIAFSVFPSSYFTAILQFDSITCGIENIVKKTKNQLVT